MSGVKEGRAWAWGVGAVTTGGGEPVELRAARVELLQRQRLLIASGAARLVRGPASITADQIAYDHTARRAVASGSVQAHTPDGIFSADRVEALVLAEEMIADGHVVVTRGDLEARAAHAIFRQQTGQAELSGGAVVHLGRNTMEAPTITVDLRARRVTATGGAHLVGYPAAAAETMPAG